MAEQSPMDYRYMRMLRRTLYYIGSWPYAVFAQSRRSFPFRSHKFIFFESSTLFLMQSHYIKDHVGVLDFYTLGHSYITTLMTVITMQRMALPWTQKYKDIVKSFVTEIHLFHYKHKSPYAMKVHEEVHKICKFLCYMVHVQIIVGPGLFNLTPVIYNYRAGMFGSERPVNGTYELSTYYTLPFDYTTNFIGYLAVSIANSFLTTDVSICFILFDLLMSLIIFHLWGHMKILDYNLRNLPRPNECDFKSSYPSEKTVLMKQMLNENIEHHHQIMKFMKKTSDAFGFTLLIYHGFHQICGCIFLFECSKLDPAAIGKYGMLTALAFQELIWVSVVFELIATKGQSLADAVYNVPWEYMDTRERRTVLIFLCNVQASSTSMKAMGLVPVGVRTMATILRTSVSYFVMLRTMAV